MEFGSLWLAVLVSAVACHVVSAVFWMVSPHHKKDFVRLPDEDSVLGAMRKSPVAPGVYMFPYCDPSKRNDPESAKKMAQGPVGMVTIGPAGLPNMGKSMALYLLFCLFVSFLTAYIARHTMTHQTPGREVLRITTAIAFGAYSLAQVPQSIWMMRPWGHTMKALFDGAIYGLITGLIFMALWPPA